MMYDFVGGPFDGIQLSKEECQLRYTLLRINALASQADEDRFVYRGQALLFRKMGKLTWNEAAQLRKDARSMFSSRKPNADQVH